MIAIQVSGEDLRAKVAGQITQNKKRRCRNIEAGLMIYGRLSKTWFMCNLIRIRFKSTFKAFD